MEENTYVRVYGHLRSFNNKRNVVAFRVLPLTDMNELTTHLLETVHGHMYMDKARATVSVAQPGSQCWPYSSSVSCATCTVSKDMLVFFA